MSQVCFICNKHLNETEIVIVERGIQTLIDSSVERNDGHFEYLKDKQSVAIHVRCRKMYTRKSSIATAKRQRETEAECDFSKRVCRNSSYSYSNLSELLCSRI
ncbi:unnamed protein product [Macrosiphum euphorbiae]|uniref:THAP-type domain-containing protein n=1 Tax=Macrosiphum euphorbiae TaxID=13131 RepID=A0AAV0XX79_9HEMI|nr:unnamed protein product [Macrosiphum euphorbiae]